MRIAIFGNTSVQKSAECESGLTAILQKFGHQVLSQDEFAGADVIITIGGDGTFLRAAAKVGNRNIPMLGINTGRLGFLADVNASDLESAIEKLDAGRYAIQKRHLLELDMNGMPAGHTPYALNDIAILKHDISSMISISTRIAGQDLITYQADGLIIATSTGSTAYSLSVGGPIVEPGTNVTVLTPVAPHSLTMRPIVLSATQTIDLDVASRSHSFLVSIDGNSFSLHEHTPLSIRRAPFTLSVIRLEGSSFYSTLQQKMLWGSDSRQ
ncbi:MAG: NAD kinase [Bacteroidaceae bacterium]|nr:NAD kinase [Bacteroidaceae bacterium]